MGHSAAKVAAEHRKYVMANRDDCMFRLFSHKYPLILNVGRGTTQSIL